MQNIIIVVVLAVFLEMLLPIGEMRKYTRMVMGLMIIVAVLQSLNGLTGGGLIKEIDQYTLNSEPGSGSSINILEDGKRLESENKKHAIDQYRSGIEKQIVSLAGVDGEMEISSAEVKINEDPTQKDFGKINSINLIYSKSNKNTNGGVRQVETVAVNVGTQKSPEEIINKPPPEYSDLVKNVAGKISGLYNLSPDQVKIFIK